MRTMEEIRKLSDELDTLFHTIVMDDTPRCATVLETRILALCEISEELDSMRHLTESPNVSLETIDLIEKDMALLMRKFKYILEIMEQEA